MNPPLSQMNPLGSKMRENVGDILKDADSLAINVIQNQKRGDRVSTTKGIATQAKEVG